MPIPDSYVALAERGLFVYDWTDVHADTAARDCYEQVAFPESPLEDHDFRDRVLRDSICVMPKASFVTDTLLDVREHSVCVHG